ADERIPRQLQHRQAAEFCLWDSGNVVVPEVLVKLKRTIEVRYAKPDVQRPHPCPSDDCLDDPATGNTRWVTRSPWTHLVGSPRGASSVANSPKKGRPWPMTTGTRSTAT